LILSFKPSFDPVPLSEKIRAGVAATAGILLIGLALRFLPQAGELGQEDIEWALTQMDSVIDVSE